MGPFEVGVYLFCWAVVALTVEEGDSVLLKTLDISGVCDDLSSPVVVLSLGTLGLKIDGAIIQTPLSGVFSPAWASADDGIFLRTELSRKSLVCRVVLSFHPRPTTQLAVIVGDFWASRTSSTLVHKGLDTRLESVLLSRDTIIPAFVEGTSNPSTAL